MNVSSVLPQQLRKILTQDSHVIAALLFGSTARGEPHRDIDLCIVLDKKYANLEMSRKRVHYTGSLPNKYDIRIFQQLPIYIRQRILKEGKIIYCKNEPLLYDIAFATIKEFNLFEKGYYAYLDKVLYG